MCENTNLPFSQMIFSPNISKQIETNLEIITEHSNLEQNLEILINSNVTKSINIFYCKSLQPLLPPSPCLCFVDLV